MPGATGIRPASAKPCRRQREDFDGSARAVDDALAELDRREAEQQEVARRARVALLEAGVRQDTLRRDAVAVAGWIAALVIVQRPAKRAAWLPEFRKHYNTYYEDGEAKGINFSLSVAIELARMMLATAHDSAERGTAALLLGSALRELEERQSDAGAVNLFVAPFVVPGCLKSPPATRSRRKRQGPFQGSPGPAPPCTRGCGWRVGWNSPARPSRRLSPLSLLLLPISLRFGRRASIICS